MSLKAFHLFFISIATLFSIWFGIWGVRAFIKDDANTLYLALGMMSFVAAIALIIYDIRVIRKFNDL